MRLTKMYLTLQYVLDLSRVECGKLIARRPIVDFEIELARYYRSFRGIILRRTFPEDLDYLLQHPTKFEFELSWYFRLFRERILRRTDPYNPNYLIQYPTRRFNNK